MYTTRNSNKNLILNCNQNIYELWMHPLFLSYPNFLFYFYFSFFDCSCLSILWLSSHSLNYTVSHFLLLFSCVLAPWYPHHVADVIFFVIIVALYFFESGFFFLEPFISPDVINVAISNHITQIDRQPEHIYLLHLCRICQCVHGCCTCVANDDHVISLIPCAQRLGTITMPITL